MDCREAEGLLPAYALNALDPEEMALVENHLETCPWCPSLLQEHLQVAAALSRAAEPIEPPRGLKVSTLRNVERQVRQRHRETRPRFSTVHLMQGAAASIAILLLATVIGVGLHTSNEMDDLQDENTDLTTRVAQISQTSEELMDLFLEQRSISYIMSSPDRQEYLLKGSEALPTAQGTLTIARQGGTGILMAKGLEPSSAGKIYNVWLRRNGQRVIVGRLSVDKNGWGVITIWPEQPITLFQQVWVTEGPVHGGMPPPATPVLWGQIFPK